MEFVPYIGPILSLIPAIIIALGISWKATLIIVGLYFIIQQLENNVLVPIIMSRNLDLSPLFVFVIMLFGASLGGVLGIIVAVPVAGIIRVLYEDIIDRKKKQGRYSPEGASCPIEYKEVPLPRSAQKTKEFFEKTKVYITNISNHKHDKK